MADTLPLIHQPDRVTRKASDVSVADWRYQTHEKKIIDNNSWNSHYGLCCCFFSYGANDI